MSNFSNKSSKENPEPEIWTMRGFLDYFYQIHDTMADRSFCFVLGAGASVTSGIVTGSQLVDKWLTELYRRYIDWNENDSDDRHQWEQITKWATSENLEIPGFKFENRAEYYPEIFERRFFQEPEEGYAYLESLMEKSEPSAGYFVLGQILASTRHRVVITTNFDDLVAHSIFMQPDSERSAFPLVIGHESLTPFVRAQLRRPLVAKIHNDRLLAPKSGPDDTAVLDPGWRDALEELFSTYTPIFIGYGGNDGSLMGFLGSLRSDAITGRMVWCYVGEKPRKQIRNIIAKHRGALVHIDGFDEIMLELSNKLFKLEDLTEAIKIRNETSLIDYKRQFARLQRLTAKRKWPAALQIEKSPNTWWEWVWAASEWEKDAEKQQQWYIRGIDEFPDSPELHGNLSIFISEAKKDFKTAENHFKEAISAAKDIDDHELTRAENNAEKFMKIIRKRNLSAKKFYFGKN